MLLARLLIDSVNYNRPGRGVNDRDVLNRIHHEGSRHGGHCKRESREGSVRVAAVESVVVHRDDHVGIVHVKLGRAEDKRVRELFSTQNVRKRRVVSGRLCYWDLAERDRVVIPSEERASG